MKHQLLLAACLALSTGSAHAGVLVVDDDGGGDATSIQAAVTAAADGDLILVRAGTYGPVAVDGKGVSIVALEPGVVIAGALQGAAILDVRNLGAAQHVLVSRVSVRSSAADFVGVTLVQNAGPVVLERVDVGLQGLASYAGDGDGALTITNSASVGLVRCSVTATNATFTQKDAAPALEITASSVHAYHSVFQGGKGGAGQGIITPGGYDGGAGAVVKNAVLFASDCHFQGGDGGPAGNDIFFAPGGDGGHGLDLAPAGTAHLLAGSYVGGVPGLGGPPTGQPGLPIAVALGATLNTIAGTPRTFTTTSPVIEGATSTFHFQGEPLETLLTFFSQKPAPLLALPFQGAAFPGAPLFAQPTGIVPYSGTHVVDVGPSLFGSTTSAVLFYLQPVFLGAGGQIRIGSPATLLVLDPSL